MARVASLQLTPPQPGNTAANIDAIRSLLHSHLASRSQEAIDLLVLPEMITTGYRFSDPNVIQALCEDVRQESSPSIALGSEIAQLMSAYVVIGFAERRESTSPSPTEEISEYSISKAYDVRTPPFYVSTQEPKSSIGYEYYNSAALFDRAGSLIHVFRKHFLYDDDKVWAQEGPGFQYVDIPDLGRLCVQICMDLNPYEFEAPFEAFELASFCRQHNVDILALPTAWLLSSDQNDNEAGGSDGSPDEPNMRTVEYWASRCKPLYTAPSPPSSDSPSTGSRGRRTIFIAANRTGTEQGVTFAGSSSIFQFDDTDTQSSTSSQSPAVGSVQLLAAMGTQTQGLQSVTVALNNRKS
ncbi:unnamed protein product [Tilletia controversa]|uniref:CN hydrolase domain-containing protein n=3 Tax=Tilletia TaxID=13289 RepID=A0A8X7SW48_9BASI|nr:hypothetical protein CF336_g3748 [Tilletia laevis]KAE8197745.1 hypothetical protein CF328_g3755 [Tilletia controversa]KAE8256874.1 hypothetical protein A4X03_0g4971 [Tilletia caries]KAE8203587.1 hypothetical protein CF335_g2959 [Tilletia laevis]KAE8245551.1 hypothetical protein A4X06_0g5606 [Tilletia controversa]